LANWAGAPRSARFIYDELGTDSCTNLSNGSPSHYTCMADGFFVAARTIQPLVLTWNQGRSWSRLGTVPDAPSKNLVNLPNEVSCVAPDSLRPTCMMVGEHYKNVRTAAQLAEVWTGTWSLVLVSTPHGSTWSSLNDVSCPTSTFCMMVGAAGTSRKTAQGVVFIPHPTAYSWNGTTATPLNAPVPAHARSAELGGLSCPTTTMCMAVGNYVSAAGKYLTYSALWNGSSWQLQPTRNERGSKFSTFNAVSCASTTTCVAVGEATGSMQAFVEQWRKGGWRLASSPTEFGAGLFSGSCPAVTRCFATGFAFGRALIESYDSGFWSAFRPPKTPAPFRGDVLTHVSCVTVTECVAVGGRYNFVTGKGQRTFRTLVEQWNGRSWQVRSTPNQ
jgi:hypothetical protein